MAVVVEAGMDVPARDWVALRHGVDVVLDVTPIIKMRGPEAEEPRALIVARPVMRIELGVGPDDRRRREIIGGAQIGQVEVPVVDHAAVATFASVDGTGWPIMP